MLMLKTPCPQQPQRCHSRPGGTAHMLMLKTPCPQRPQRSHSRPGGTAHMLMLKTPCPQQQQRPHSRPGGTTHKLKCTSRSTVCQYRRPQRPTPAGRRDPTGPVMHYPQKGSHKRGPTRLSEDGTTWRNPGHTLFYGGSRGRSPWRPVHPDDLHQTVLPAEPDQGR
jgi:hypothetical protein